MKVGSLRDGMTRDDMIKEKKTDPLSFEQAYERLEAIVQLLDEGDLKLDELETKFEEGMRMAAYCSQRLEQVEQKVNLLVEKTQGALERRPYEDQEEA